MRKKIYIICPIFFGVIFTLTGSVKYVYSEMFIDAVIKLQGIPFKDMVILFLPPLEICIGISMLVKIRFAMVFGLALNSIFLYIILYNYLDGNLGVDCGCFGDLLKSQIGIISIIRQTILLCVNGLYVFSIDIPLLTNKTIKFNIK